MGAFVVAGGLLLMHCYLSLFSWLFSGRKSNRLVGRRADVTDQLLGTDGLGHADVLWDWSGVWGRFYLPILIGLAFFVLQIVGSRFWLRV